MQIVLLQGAFEIIHSGHIKTFRRARSEGDKLIVALNTNRLLKQYKNRNAVMAWKDKKAVIQAIEYVDLVVPAHSFSPLKLLKQYEITVYAVGSEWVDTKSEEFEYMRSIGGRIVVMPRYKGCSSTSEIKRRLLMEAQR